MFYAESMNSNHKGTFLGCLNNVPKTFSESSLNNNHQEKFMDCSWNISWMLPKGSLKVAKQYSSGNL